MTSLKSMWAAVAAAGLVTAIAVARAPDAPPQKDAAWHNAQALYLLELQSEEGWRSTASGLRYRVVKEGPGDARPSPTELVTIHYTGRFIDGTEFDSSVLRGEPATFPLPKLIKGWQEGVPLMTVGDTYEFAIPYHLAYGAKGKGPIPGGATLLFTIELIGIGEHQPS